MLVEPDFRCGSGPKRFRCSRENHEGVGTPQLAPTGSLKFSGYDWAVRMIESDKGGVNNLYDPENTWTDTSGALHMQIKKKSDRWSCAEVFLNRSQGYGTAYSWELNA
jgi:hypothetical protein